MDNLLNKELFMNAWRGTSFEYEKVGLYEYENYSNELKKDIEIVEDKERFIKTYKKYLYDWLNTQSTCISPMITGPAKFPVNKNMKRVESAMNKYAKFREVRDKMLKESNKINIDIYQELEKNKEELKELKELQQYYKDVNKSRILEGTDIPEELEEWRRYKCIPSFYLTSIRNKIKTREQRIKLLEKKIYLKENKKNEIVKETNNYKIIKNYEIDRIQIKFVEKPGFNTLQKLKSRGFKWSPNNMAWQRKITPNAIYELKRLEL